MTGCQEHYTTSMYYPFKTFPSKSMLIKILTKYLISIEQYLEVMKRYLGGLGAPFKQIQ